MPIKDPDKDADINFKYSFYKKLVWNIPVEQFFFSTVSRCNLSSLLVKLPEILFQGY